MRNIYTAGQKQFLFHKIKSVNIKYFIVEIKILYSKALRLTKTYCIMCMYYNNIMMWAFKSDKFLCFALVETDVQNHVNIDENLSNVISTLVTKKFYRPYRKAASSTPPTTTTQKNTHKSLQGQQKRKTDSDRIQSIFVNWKLDLSTIDSNKTWSITQFDYCQLH